MVKVYLASPYSSPSKRKERERFMLVCKAARTYIKQGYNIFSPIAHSHAIAMIGKLPVDHNFWIEQNRSWLDWCDQLWVLCLPGWGDSKGVAWEIEEAQKRGLPVFYVGGD